MNRYFEEQLKTAKPLSVKDLKDINDNRLTRKLPLSEYQVGDIRLFFMEKMEHETETGKIALRVNIITTKELDDLYDTHTYEKMSGIMPIFIRYNHD